MLSNLNKKEILTTEMLTLLFLVHELPDFISSFNYSKAASEIIFIFWTNTDERTKKNGQEEKKYCGTNT